jgi:hypothetical protein
MNLERFGHSITHWPQKRDGNGNPLTIVSAFHIDDVGLQLSSPPGDPLCTTRVTECSATSLFSDGSAFESATGFNTANTRRRSAFTR